MTTPAATPSTLADYLTVQGGDDRLSGLILAVAAACVEISGLVERGALANVLGAAGGAQNVQGEDQKKLDVISNDLLIAAAQAYASRGLFTNALAVIDRKLRLTPDDPTWLFGKGYASIQAGAYDEAITALTRLLALQTNNTDALFNRAIARLKSDQLDAARADYQALQGTFTNSFQIAYGLGEIAWRKHETNEAVKHYRLYLTTADTNTAEAKAILQRLQEISKPAH